MTRSSRSDVQLLSADLVASIFFALFEWKNCSVCSPKSATLEQSCSELSIAYFFSQNASSKSASAYILQMQQQAFCRRVLAHSRNWQHLMLHLNMKRCKALHFSPLPFPKWFREFRLKLGTIPEAMHFRVIFKLWAGPQRECHVSVV